LELKIEKLIYGGDGLARLPSVDPGRAGKAVFVPFTIAGEVVEATITEQKQGFARARAERIVQISPERTQPGCPYFGDCGGCQYQHMTYEAQLRAKADILRETLLRTAKITPPDITTHASPSWNYRNRTRMRVQQPPGPSAALRAGSANTGLDRGTHFAIGYNRFALHVLLPVRECPISSPLINRTLAAIWKIGESGRMPQGVVEIEFFANAEDTEILLEVTLERGSERRNLRQLDDFVQDMRAQAVELVGVAPFAQAQAPGRVQRIDLTEEQQSALGRDSLAYRTRGAQYQVSAGSFFQTNRYLVDSMVALATDGHTGDRALDLYAGVGLFTLPLSQTFREVAAVEVAPFSFHDLHANSPSNTKGHRVRVEDFLNTVEDTRFDYVVLDPPRGGLGESAAKLLAGFAAPRITYVSCDPATLARDLKVLVAGGYRLDALHLLDLFPQTFHIETVVHLAL
jgi:23S rRNA (uracil1939-C5)-methyltransferase